VDPIRKARATEPHRLLTKLVLYGTNLSSRACRSPPERRVRMRSNTEHVTINTDHRHLFTFLADPGNLPKWAVGFCRAIRRDGDRWMVQTLQGEVAVRYVTQPDLGIIDFYISLAPETEVTAFSRVLPNGDGSE